MGVKNYWYFFFLCLIVWVQSVLHNFISCVILYEFIWGNFSASDIVVFYDMMLAYSCMGLLFNVPVTVFLTYLSTYHIWLRCKNLTTYQHILN